MRLITLFGFCISLLFSSQASIEHYKASAKNHLLCKFTANTYKIINKKNSSIEIINNSKFFKLRNENIYINSAGCHIIKPHGSAIIF